MNKQHTERELHLQQPHDVVASEGDAYLTGAEEEAVQKNEEPKEELTQTTTENAGEREPADVAVRPQRARQLHRARLAELEVPQVQRVAVVDRERPRIAAAAVRRNALVAVVVRRRRRLVRELDAHRLLRARHRPLLLQLVEVGLRRGVGRREARQDAGGEERTH